MNEIIKKAEKVVSIANRIQVNLKNYYWHQTTTEEKRAYETEIDNQLEEINNIIDTKQI